jgi:hypothetical protein
MGPIQRQTALVTKSRSSIRAVAGSFAASSAPMALMQQQTQCHQLRPCTGLGSPALPCRRRHQSQPPFSSSCKSGADRSRIGLIPTSTAASTLYQPSEQSSNSAATSGAINIQLPIALQSGLFQAVSAISKLVNFLVAIVERARDAIAAAFPQLQGVSAQVC